jgi:hypothetical protein
MPFGTATEKEMKTEMTDKELKDQAERQRAAAKRTLAVQEDYDKRHQDAHVDSMLTNDVHVGKAKEEPHKDTAMEDLKVDKGRITGAPDVHTAPLKTEGETTDEVVTSPAGARPKGGAPATMPQRAAAAAEGKGAQKGAQKSAQKGKRK